MREGKPTGVSRAHQVGENAHRRALWPDCKAFYCRILVGTDPSRIFASAPFLSFSTESANSDQMKPSILSPPRLQPPNILMHCNIDADLRQMRQGHECALGKCLTPRERHVSISSRVKERDRHEADAASASGHLLSYRDGSDYRSCFVRFQSNRCGRRCKGPLIGGRR
jgi:hypothetical protein